MPDKIKLQGRVFITGEIHALTGLHIGGGAEGVSIGGIDNIVVRDTLTQVPYIPGSSLKGKMRSLSEKLANLPQNQSIGSGVRIHTCENKEEYQNCHVCHIYGLPGERDFSTPTRLIVRDVRLDIQQFPPNAKTDFPYTEIKWEAAIDRITSAAVPRQMERVPAGSEFATKSIHRFRCPHPRMRQKRGIPELSCLPHLRFAGRARLFHPDQAYRARCSLRHPAISPEREDRFSVHGNQMGSGNRQDYFGSGATSDGTSAGGSYLQGI